MDIENTIVIEESVEDKLEQLNNNADENHAFTPSGEPASLPDIFVMSLEQFISYCSSCKISDLDILKDKFKSKYNNGKDLSEFEKVKYLKKFELNKIKELRAKQCWPPIYPYAPFHLNEWLDVKYFIPQAQEHAKEVIDHMSLYGDMNNINFGKDGQISLDKYNKEEEILGNYYKYGHVISREKRAALNSKSYRRLTRRRLLNNFYNCWDNEDGSKTIYYKNTDEYTKFYILFDLDTTDNAQLDKRDEVGKMFNQEYLGGKGWVDRSTRGKGIHIYLGIDITDIKHIDMKHYINAMNRFIKSNFNIDKYYGYKFDKIQGQPTCYTRKWLDDDKKYGYKQIKRGDCGSIVKLPNLHHPQDLLAFKQLQFIDFRQLFKSIVTTDIAKLSIKKIKIENKNYIKNNINGTSGYKKIANAVLHCFREQNTSDVSTDYILNYYHNNCNPSGMTEKDIEQRIKRIEKFKLDAAKDFTKKNNNENDNDSSLNIRCFNKIKLLIDHEIRNNSKLIDYLKTNNNKLKTKIKGNDVWLRYQITIDKVIDFTALYLFNTMFNLTLDKYQHTTLRDRILSYNLSFKNIGLMNWSINRQLDHCLINLCKDCDILNVEDSKIRFQKNGGDWTKSEKGVGKKILPGTTLNKINNAYYQKVNGFIQRANDLLDKSINDLNKNEITQTEHIENCRMIINKRNEYIKNIRNNFGKMELINEQ